MGKGNFRFALIVSMFLGGGSTASAQVAQDVLTSHNDIYRSGVYAAEKTLKPNNVNRRTFGIAFTRQVVGQIWGQPLYVHGVGKHNVVYVATSENYVYAFDADDMSTNEQTPPLHSIQLGKPSAISSSVFGTIYPSNGISSTPVIDLDPQDPGNGTLYVVAKVIPPDNGDAKFHNFALNLANLAQIRDTTIDASAPKTTGANPSVLKFYDTDHLNRPALLIAKNHLVVAFGSGPNNDQDGRSYHGWVMSYSLPGLNQTGVFVTTPNGGMGGIWQAGAGPAADDQGNVYVMTGNGHFRDAVGGAVHPDLADSFIKLDNSTGKLSLADWYTPPSRDFMEACDMDLGASGPGVMPDAGLVFGAGKTGIFYARNNEHMGGTDTPLADPGQWTGAADCSNGQCFRVAQNVHGQHMVQQTCDMSGFPYSTSTGFNTSSWNATLNSYPHVHGAPVLWKLSPKVADLYVWPEEDYLKDFRFEGRTFNPSPIGKSAPVDAANMSMPGGVLSLSWDGSKPQTAILWASRPDPMAPKGISGPVVNSFTGHDQQHFVYRDADGIVWDEYYCPGCNDANGGYPWRLQQINCGADSDGSCRFKNGDAVSAAPAADAGPVVVTYAEHDQQHFVFKSADGGIWDVFYCPGCSGAAWRAQRVNMGPLTNAPAAVGAPFVDVYSGHDQMHYVYRAAQGEIWDVFYCPGCSNNIWRAQQLNCGPGSDSSCPIKNADAVTGAPAAVDGPTVNTYTEHDQQHFAYTAKGGVIWDIFYCPDCSGASWRTQQINMSGGTAGGPAAVAAPAVVVYSGHDQQHFVYRDASGFVQDAFYCPGCNNGHWHLQQINCGPHSTNACATINANATSAAPAAADGPAVSLYSGHDQLHYAFKDAKGVLQDVYNCPRCSNGSWQLQQINAPGLTVGPPAAAAPSINVYDGHDQQHFAYRDASGNLWDAFACPGCDNGYWQLQKITPCGDVMSHMSDLTPNDAPCNAINKLVRGYLQAFTAVPSASGQLQELWNSDENPGDVVRWFSKESPPTIADGKVFLAEFPPKPTEGRWNANTALGRLLVYARRR
jgi:predicted nucleic-acid-binding Zn-ribbon protein